jgi:hypothetical protein
VVAVVVFTGWDVVAAGKEVVVCVVLLQPNRQAANIKLKSKNVIGLIDLFFLIIGCSF